ncbi:MAG: DUF6504 family protein [Anaerolineae bacterium]
MSSSGHEHVQLLSWRLGYFPAQFVWRGRVHHVIRVQGVWEECRDWPRRRQFRFYRLLCAAGPFVLRHDLVHNLWHAVGAPSAASLPESEGGSLRRSWHAGRFALVR